MAHIADVSGNAHDAKPANEIAAEAGVAAPTNTAGLLTPSQAADYLGVSVATLVRRTTSGQIACFRMSRKIVRYARGDLDSYIASTHSLQAAATLKEAA